MRRESRRLFTFGLFLLLALVILIAGGRTGVFRPLVNLVMIPLAPVARVITGGVESAAAVVNPPESVTALREQNRELERAVAELQVEIVRLREIERDYQRLSGLVNYSAENPDQSLITADVVARDTSSYLRWIIINRGARDGIKEGDPVISDLGLVGLVENVAANAAWIRLANDPGSLVNARTQNTRAEGIVIGQLQGDLRMENIPQVSIVEVGDLVLTSGLGGSFPGDIVIGQITSVRKQPAALFQEAEIRPTVDFDNLDIVSVITAFQPVDPSLFQNEIQGGGTP